MPRFTSLTLLLALSASVSAAETADVTGKSAVHQIAAVTVYQGTALVTREVTVPEGLGTMELIVAPLPPETVSSSLYSEGNEGVRILNTRFRSRPIHEDTREEVRKLETQIKELQLSVQRQQAEAKALEQNQQFVTKLEGFTGATLQHLTDKGVLNSEATITLAKFVMQTRDERSKQLVALQQSITAAEEQSIFLKRQLQEKTAGVSRTERDAVIVVDKANAAAGKIRLNYLVGAVSWQPHYKFRAGKDKEPVTLEYLATVRQQTGEDWSGVALTLSTAQPMLNAAPPDLRTLEVSAFPAGHAGKGVVANMPPGGDYRTIIAQGRVSRQQSQELSNSNNFIDSIKVINDAAAMEQFGELLASKEDITKVKIEFGDGTEGPSVTYRLKSKLSLPSRVDEQVLELTRLELSPDYFYKAVPVLTPHVYRQANLTNTSDYVLLPGEATMYLGTDFVGRAQLPLVAIGKQFTVGFGVDPQLQVQRQLQNKTRSTTGGNQVLTFDYRILVSSYKKEPVRLQLWDRLPKAEAQAVAVTLVSQKPEVSADPLYVREDRPKNLLRWDITVQPAQNGEKALAVDYEFKLELDKQMQIGIVVAK